MSNELPPLDIRYTDPGADFWSVVEDVCDQAARAWDADPRASYVEVQLGRADVDTLRAAYVPPPEAPPS